MGCIHSSRGGAHTDQGCRGGAHAPKFTHIIKPSEKNTVDRILATSPMEIKTLRSRGGAHAEEQPLLYFYDPKSNEYVPAECIDANNIPASNWWPYF